MVVIMCANNANMDGVRISYSVASCNVPQNVSV